MDVDDKTLQQAQILDFKPKEVEREVLRCPMPGCASMAWLVERDSPNSPAVLKCMYCRTPTKFAVHFP